MQVLVEAKSAHKISSFVCLLYLFVTNGDPLLIADMQICRCNDGKPDIMKVDATTVALSILLNSVGASSADKSLEHINDSNPDIWTILRHDEAGTDRARLMYAHLPCRHASRCSVACSSKLAGAATLSGQDRIRA